MYQELFERQSWSPISLRKEAGLAVSKVEREKLPSAPLWQLLVQPEGSVQQPRKEGGVVQARR